MAAVPQFLSKGADELRQESSLDGAPDLLVRLALETQVVASRDVAARAKDFIDLVEKWAGRSV
jgi:hypothetical protein